MLKLEKQTIKKLASSGQPALDLKSPLFEIFHDNTKLTPLSGRAYSNKVARILRSPAAQRLMANPYKIYNLQDKVELPQARPTNPLEESIAARRSVRSFSGEPIELEELSRLLFFSYGRTDPRGLFRAVSSGGALYPLELYVAVNRVNGLAPGIYHYDVEHHGLDVLRTDNDWKAVRDCTWLTDIKDPDNVAAIVFFTAIFRRSTFKYQDRGYRLILIEAGEAAQNMTLLATSMGLGSCLLGGFLDDALSTLLEIDGLDEAPLLPVVLGRKRPKPTLVETGEHRE